MAGELALRRFRDRVALARDLTSVPDEDLDDESRVLRDCAWVMAADALLAGLLTPLGVRWRVDRALEMRALAIEMIEAGHTREAVGAADEARALYEQASVALLRWLLSDGGGAHG